MKTSPWAAIVGYYLIGVFAAAQLGKMSALVPLIAADLGLSLTTAAAAVSLLEVGGALLGTVAGLLAARLGLRPTLLVSVACLAAAGLGSGLAQGAVSLLGWRLLEALGYLGVIVTVPVLIVAAATPAAIGTAMALWSSFLPVGLAVGAALWAAMAAASSWRVAMATGGVLGLLALLATMAAAWRARRCAPVLSAKASTGGTPDARHDAAADSAEPPGIGAGPWFLATSFGCYALFEVGLLALLPLYLTRQAGSTVAEAGSWTAFASLATIAGSAAAAWCVRRGIALKWPMLLSLLLPAALLFVVFVDHPQASTVGWLAVLLNAVSGIYPSLAFAWLPQLAGSARRMVRANGLFAQFGASGSLLGPPLVAACVAQFGWPSAAWFGLLVTLPSIWLALRALAVLQRQPPASPPSQLPAEPLSPARRTP